MVAAGPCAPESQSLNSAKAATCAWLQGAAVAIDSAVPRREDAGPMAAVGDPNYPALAAAMNIIDLVRLTII